jgi:hypothetical protein
VGEKVKFFFDAIEIFPFQELFYYDVRFGLILLKEGPASEKIPRGRSC